MKKDRRRNGLLLAVDDLQKGLLVTIHHWRDRREWGMGVALRIDAINLPYLVAQPLNDAEARPAILDLRRIRLMRISEEFARARRPAPPPPRRHPWTTYRFNLLSGGRQPPERR